MRALAFRVLLLLCLAAPTVGQTDEWKRYKNTEGNFSVLFPTEPTDTKNKSEEGIESHTLLSSVRPVAYTVIYAAMANEQPVNDATYDTFKNAVFKELPKCTVMTDKAGSPAVQSYISVRPAHHQEIYRLIRDHGYQQIDIQPHHHQERVPLCAASRHKK